MQLFVHTCEFQVEKGMLCYLKIQLCGFRLVLIIKTNLPLGGRVKLSGCKRINRQWSQGGTFWKIKINKPQSHCTDCWSSVFTAIKFRKIPAKICENRWCILHALLQPGSSPLIPATLWTFRHASLRHLRVVFKDDDLTWGPLLPDLEVEVEVEVEGGGLPDHWWVLH